MSSNREFHWQAYLDGELTAAEAAEFEASLSPQERERLAAELRFERAMAERLRQEGECPNAVWKNTRRMIARSQRSAAPTRRWYWGGASLAAAAAIAFMLAAFGPSVTSPDNRGPILAASSVDEMTAVSEIGPGHENAAAFFQANNIPMGLYKESALEAMPGPHYAIRIVGARRDRLAGEPITELMMSCCGRPVRIIVAERGSKAAKRLGDAAGEKDTNDIQAIRIVNGYLTAVVAKHPATQLLNVIEGPDHIGHEHAEGHGPSDADFAATTLQ